MSTMDHADRYAEMAQAFKLATGKVLMGYVVIGVASDGEVFYGASVPGQSEARPILLELRKAVKFAESREKA